MFRAPRTEHRAPTPPSAGGSGPSVPPPQQGGEVPYSLRRNVPGEAGYRRPEGAPWPIDHDLPIVVEAPASVAQLLEYARQIDHHRVEQIEQIITSAANQAAMTLAEHKVRPDRVVLHEHAQDSPRPGMHVHAHLYITGRSSFQYRTAAVEAHRTYQTLLRGHLESVGFRWSRTADSPHRWELDDFPPDRSLGDVTRCGADAAALWPLERMGKTYRPLGRLLAGEHEDAGPDAPREDVEPGVTITTRQA